MKILKFFINYLKVRKILQINSDEVVQSLEREVEDVCNELSADAIRADVMDNMFGSEINITPEEWKASIESVF